MHIALIGDYNSAVVAHQAIPLALQLAAKANAAELALEWVATDTVDDLTRFDGLWCVPGSPYRDMDGALRAIRHARERQIPYLGTCAGFQHAVIEYARNVLGWADADHAETAPDAQRAVIAALSCSLVEVSSAVYLQAGSRIAEAYGTLQTSEGYHCRYGLNAEFQAALLAGPLRIAAVDDAGDVRAIELDGHPFFVATLFQPERAALQGQLPPLVSAFVQAIQATGKRAQ